MISCSSTMMRLFVAADLFNYLFKCEMPQVHLLILDELCHCNLFRLRDKCQRHTLSDVKFIFPLKEASIILAGNDSLYAILWFSSLHTLEFPLNLNLSIKHKIMNPNALQSSESLWVWMKNICGP